MREKREGNRGHLEAEAGAQRQAAQGETEADRRAEVQGEWEEDGGRGETEEARGDD